MGQGGKIQVTMKRRKSKKQDIAEKVLFGKGRFKEYWSPNNKLGAIWHSKRIKHTENKREIIYDLMREWASLKVWKKSSQGHNYDNLTFLVQEANRVIASKMKSMNP